MAPQPLAHLRLTLQRQTLQPRALRPPREPQPGQSLSSSAETLANLLQPLGFSWAALVARAGTVLLRQGFGLADREQGLPNTPHTRFRLGSLTKPFTSTAVLTLQHQGRLAVQGPICKYLPDCLPAWRRVTLHHLLSHTSFQPGDLQYPGACRQVFGSPVSRVGESNRKSVFADDADDGADKSFFIKGKKLFLIRVICLIRVIRD